MFLSEGYLGEMSVGDAELDLLAYAPVNLNSYQNVPDTVVNYWSLSPFSYLFYSLGWELQTDLVDTFDSSDLLIYQSDEISPTDYVTGYMHRGISVPIYPRLEGEARRMYWRVRATYGAEVSSWATSYFDLPAAINTETRESLLSFLPDALYKKDSASNVYKIHDAYAQEFEKVNKELTLVNNDNYIKSARDAALQPNFGDLVGLEKPDVLKMVDYRELLRAFMTNVRLAPSNEAIRNLVYTVYRVDPVFRRIVDLYGRYVFDTGLDNSYVYDAGLAEEYVWDDRHLGGGMVIEVDRQLPPDSIIKGYVEGIVRNMGQLSTPIYVREL
jgi:hypothetical protein